MIKTIIRTYNNIHVAQDLIWEIFDNPINYEKSVHVK